MGNKFVSSGSRIGGNWANTYILIFLVSADVQQEVERHLDMGKKLLSKGQFADALTHYHSAIELDPTNYMTYYRRATVLLAMGKVKAALPDLDKVVELKADFISVIFSFYFFKFHFRHWSNAEIFYWNKANLTTLKKIFGKR